MVKQLTARGITGCHHPILHHHTSPAIFQGHSGDLCESVESPFAARQTAAVGAGDDAGAFVWTSAWFGALVYYL